MAWYNRLYGAARGVAQWAIEQARPVAAFLGLAEEVEAPVSPMEAVAAISHAHASGKWTEDLRKLRHWDSIPEDWYVEKEIPWKQPFAYTVEMYGRDVLGRYSHKTRTRTYSRALTVGEIMDDSAATFGREGDSPEFIEIYGVSVTEAFVRAGEIR